MVMVVSCNGRLISTILLMPLRLLHSPPVTRCVLGSGQPPGLLRNGTGYHISFYKLGNIQRQAYGYKSAENISIERRYKVWRRRRVGLPARTEQQTHTNLQLYVVCRVSRDRRRRWDKWKPNTKSRIKAHERVRNYMYRVKWIRLNR